MNKSIGLVCTLAAACGMSGAALAANSAANPAGFYVGAGVGEGNVSNYGYGYYGNYYGYNQYDVAWKLMAGVRPIAPFGVEAEWIDFGNGNAGANDYYTSVNSDQKAGALFAIGYLPIPFIDIFGKAGVARLETNTTAYYPGPIVPVCTPYCGNSYSSNAWTTNFAWGLGLQSHFANFALRAEYERVQSSYGSPDALTVSLTYTF
jgi:hypothetical protein